MPESLSTADRIVRVWLGTDDEDVEEIKRQIVCIREDFFRDNPHGNYPGVLREALAKLSLIHEEERQIRELTAEDFND